MRRTRLFWALGALLVLLTAGISGADEAPLPPPRVGKPGALRPPAVPAPARATPVARPARPLDLRRRLVQALPAAQQTELAFLEHVGWRVVPGKPGSGVTTHGGYATRYSTIAAAQQAGCLQIRVAPDASSADLRAAGRTFGPLGLALPTRLAYKHKVWRANYESTRKLAENTRRGNYTFPAILGFESPWFKMKPPQPEWQRGKWKSVARVPPSQAIPPLYSRVIVMECYTAQWIAMYATQYELLGPRAMDEAYKPSDLVIGRPGEMLEAPLGHFLPEKNSGDWRSLVLGPNTVGKDPGVELAKLGPVAWAGATGVSENVERDLFTNDNFIVVNVTPRANQALLEKGGLAYIVRQVERIWEIHKHGRRGAYPGSSGLEAERRIEKLLQDPVFSEMTVYIHPYGVKPLRWIVYHRTKETHRPVKVRIYRNGVADAFFRRYRDQFLRRPLSFRPR